MTHPKVDALFNQAKRWKPEMSELRRIVLSCGLTEEFKWYQPVYSFNGANLLIIGSFKNHCTLSFFKGVLLKDTKKILVSPGPNSQSVRILRFTSVEEIKRLERTILAYIRESIRAEKSGKQVVFKDIKQHEVPVELQAEFDKSRSFQKSFSALTPGRQRGYLLYFSSAKLSDTRISRINKCKAMIRAGKGLND